MSLLPVGEALARILDDVSPTEIEAVPLCFSQGRVLAISLAARRTHPDFISSAMDGYAIRYADLAQAKPLAIVGTAAAGQAYEATLETGQAARIFTGAPVPKGADTVVMQEHVKHAADHIIVTAVPLQGANIRARGIDFKHGETLLIQGRRLGPRDIALAAAMNHATLPVRRRPKIAVLSTGDELRAPGEALGRYDIVASNAFAIAGMIGIEGAESLDLGIAPDDPTALSQRIKGAIEAKIDVLVTIGGASVGERDLVQAALKAEGVDIGFWKIAMRPGKPMMHGTRGRMLVLGLPGNPASAFVCGVVFLIPLIRALLGRIDANPYLHPALWAVDCKANDARQDYIRARMDIDDRLGVAKVTPLSIQDSSMTAILQRADCLVPRSPFAPAAKAGERCQVIDLRAAGY